MNRWTTGQVSKMRNVSVRTLRYYDDIGLLTPSQKEDNGRRYYSETDLFTLEKITLLKSLSLPLEDIQQLIDKLSYRHILTAHYNLLQEQLTSLQTSISNTATLIHMIDIEGNLSWEKVSNLVQNAPANSKQWMDYFEEEESELLRRTLPNLGNSDPLTQQYASLLRRIEWCIQQSILPESDEGYKIANEMHELSMITFDGDEELIEKFWEVRKRPVSETGLFPISDEVLEFVERSTAYALEQEKAEIK
ncbi:MerR family transcriptional regulator [Paenibacillus alvei]|uniref:MerR family transcriptional regulator n=1 Tax=Paenibacillus alvei TaxID=44250 RepID=A0AAP7A0L8_PAEAL|nr:MULTISPECIES: MerR family transcriptional regulator [Paenibacillus]MBG9733401.1 transcriptional regulator [Paenibacillus alvei]MBG9742744.1 transcriptional regulator [Paenibacillus alvei]MCY9581426.1 MerR family transcriptional regulator [Paenibacillus alvei]MCY9585566.1 MerR family transcriptional regulator [Paenibacillus alvei]MCY9733270.1 MerR family transcriptional regulator [Paenibacillus alvei]